MEQTLEWTGERLVTSITSIGAIEHLHRYAFALEFVENKIVLDIASGEGYGSNLLSDKAKHVIGVDISEEAISHALKKYKKDNLVFKVGSVSSIPIDQSSIDIVVSFETIEHIHEQKEMLNEIKRVLKPNGMLIMSSPEKANYEDVNKNKNHFHVKELYFSEFNDLVRSNFLFYKYLFQKEIYGTLIAPKEDIRRFNEYAGSYDLVKSYDILNKPVFNICIASDLEIPTLGVSYFDANECYNSTNNALNIEIVRILNSKTYKLGKLLILPFRKVKNIFKL